MPSRSTLRVVPDLPKPKDYWLEVTVRPEQFGRARDALMYWEVGNDPARAKINTADIRPDDVRSALTDDATGPLDCLGIIEIEEV